jgi:hypothetical protein
MYIIRQGKNILEVFSKTAIIGMVFSLSLWYKRIVILNYLLSSKTMPDSSVRGNAGIFILPVLIPKGTEWLPLELVSFETSSSDYIFCESYSEFRIFDHVINTNL